MFRKKETEFQYAPGIEKIIEDIQGGGTIARAELKGIIDELPPLVIVGKDSNGLYHVVKTAKLLPRQYKSQKGICLKSEKQLQLAVLLRGRLI